MDLTTEIRPEIAADRQGIRELLTAAFDSSNEADLVDALRDDGALAVSLTAGQGNAIIGLRDSPELATICRTPGSQSAWVDGNSGIAWATNSVIPGVDPSLG